MSDTEELRGKLQRLRQEHRDLDLVIAQLAAHAPHNELQLKRLKKRKLVLKDLISQIQDQLYPDIIA